MVGWNPCAFVFVHIPKCAGTSIEEALIPIVSDRNGFSDCSEEVRCKFWLPGNKGLQHQKLWQYEQYFELSDHFKFAFVRNPWDRAISQINYLRSKTGEAVFSGKTLKENIKIYCTSSRNIWWHDLGARQADYLKNNQGNLCMDFIGRFESLSTDFQKICMTMGIKPVPNLPHIFNSRQTRHYSTFYDGESAAWIGERFAEDIDLFGYHFESL